MRIKRGVMHVKRRRNILARVKGYQYGRKNILRLAKTAILKAGQHGLRDRRKKKAQFRGLWNVRINAAVREHGLNYSEFIHALKEKNIELDRKVMSTIAKDHPEVFLQILEAVK